jgi:GH15 family glucan-1,4-alpha-glucosidase
MAVVALRIEDYGIIGDLHTVALVGRNGSIDWLCLPRFDSDACFAGLLGDDKNGFWRIAPATDDHQARRRYRGDTLVLETEFETADGIAKVIDCMPIREDHPQVVRVVEAVRGEVAMRMDLVIRFGYGSMVPWVRRADGLLSAIAGPDALALWTPIETRGEDMTTVAEFKVSATEHIPFVLTWYPSHETAPRPVDASYAIHDTQMWWEDWAATSTFEGEWRDPVMRSLITLKALTYQPTGGIVAAATTSLPETLGGERNWDYRYCWLRDATLTLESLMRGGYHEEALAWRDWLLRAVAGDVSQLQIMYGPAGERRLDEWQVDWLPGYEGSAPVRVGNAASGQFQLDVYGEVLSALYEACGVGTVLSATAWDLQRALVEFVARSWEQPDDGIWEVRGPRRHFTHSKVMAWVALDRGVRTIEDYGVEGPVERWRELRDRIHDQVCTEGYNTKVGAFTQYYGSDALDASLLMIPLVGFLPASDDRVRSTVEAVERGLTEDGFVLRYRTEDSGGVDGLHGHEGAFLACSFWMADCLHMIGRYDDAHAMLDRLIGLGNDLGLLSEEYDVRAGRQVGNFPQAFSHVSLVNAAFNLSGHPTMEEQVVPDAELIRRSAGHRRVRASVVHGPRPPRRTLSAGDRSAPAPTEKTKNTKRRWAR